MVLNCAGETRKRDVTTMFTYSHANTPRGESERAYYLSYFINNIVDPDQTYSVPGRSIFSNLFQIGDILNYIEQTGETSILVSLDQEKAFDRVNQSFLMDLLCHLGFRPVFRNWIHTFYSRAYMRIILNGYLTDKIFLQCGVRKGDPLSPLLYVICVEALTNLIRAQY